MPASDAAKTVPAPPKDPAVHRTDVVVIGAGPVGLFTVFQCGMLRLSCHVVDALEAPGGQCSALYPEKPIYDIPGCPSILAGDLIDRLMTQSAPFHPKFHLGQQVTGLERVNGPVGGIDAGTDGGPGASEQAQEDGAFWRLTTATGTQLEAPVVILAAGAGAFGPNRPPLQGLERHEGSSVFYMVARKEAFRDRRVVIAGGGDSAVDWALALQDIAARVMVVHRRAKFRCAPESAARLKDAAAAGQLDLVTPYQLHGLEEDDSGALCAVTVADLDGGVKRLLPFFGLATDLGPIASWGVNLELHRVPIDQSTSATNLPGVFAVGDVAHYAGKLKLILTGFAEAAQAAHAAFPICRPGEALRFEHSTTSGVPLV
ncbi:MAG: NAD(P)/FAD-dependent oxidoreductase [Rhodospirillaceae bacterium]